jgi:hypothetical protein
MEFKGVLWGENQVSSATIPGILLLNDVWKISGKS